MSCYINQFVRRHGFAGMGRAFFCLAIVCGWLFPSSLRGADLTLKATFNQEAIILGDSAMLSLTFTGGSVDIQPPVIQLPNARVFNPTRSVQWTSINGRQSISVSYNYLVTPVRSGEIRLVPVTLTVNGQQVVSNEATLRVLTPDQASQYNAEQEQKLAFVRLKIPKKKLYVGEVMAAQIQVFGLTIEHLQLHQFKAEGFTLGKAANTIPSRIQEDGKIYQVYTFHVPVAPRRSGKLTIGPAECTLDVRTSTSGPQDPFSRLDPFARTQIKSLRVRSEATEIEVLPLPEAGRPESFSGAVGQFQMAVNASPVTNLTVGDPITFSVEIQARGTLDDLSLKEQEGWREFKVYPATSRILNRDGLGLSGTKLFEQIVVPMNSEVSELPPFEFSYFDPSEERYKTLVQPAIAISVRPNPNQIVNPPGLAGALQPKPETDEETAEFRHIKPRLGLIQTSSLLFQRPWFLLVQITPVALWLGLYVRRRRKESLANNPKKLREKNVDDLVRSGLRELHRLADDQNNTAFHETTMRLLKERLGERLDLPAQSITEEVVDEHLSRKGLPESDLTALHELFAHCNQARYAGGESSRELNSQLGKIESMLVTLRKLPSP